MLTLWTILAFVTLSSVYVDCQTCAKSENLDCEVTGDSVTDIESGTTMALMVYDESTLLPFHKDKRVFTFGGQDVEIKQRWREVGVAAVVWDAAVVLGEYMVTRKELVQGRRVIELGAGTGLAGIVAAMQGGEVITTERDVGMEILNENVNLNLAKYKDAKIKVQELEWGTNLQLYPRAFDIILGADIIYIEETFRQLFDTLVHLSNSETLVFLSCKLRYERDSTFLNLLKEKFIVAEVFYDEQRDIHVYSARKLDSS